MESKRAEREAELRRMREETPKVSRPIGLGYSHQSYHYAQQPYASYNYNSRPKKKGKVSSFFDGIG